MVPRQGDGGFLCLNDYEVTFTTSGGMSAPTCYRLTILTNQGANTITIPARLGTRSGGYANDTDIFFKVEKTCTLPGTEISYMIQFHL